MNVMPDFFARRTRTEARSSMQATVGWMIWSSSPKHEVVFRSRCHRFSRKFTEKKQERRKMHSPTQPKQEANDRSFLTQSCLTQQHSHQNTHKIGWCALNIFKSDNPSFRQKYDAVLYYILITLLSVTVKMAIFRGQ